MAEINKSLKVAFICPINDNKLAGGADNHINNLLTKLRNDSNIEIHVITMDKKIKSDSSKKKNGVFFHYLKSPNIPKTVSAITKDYKAIMDKILRINPDIIHAQMFGAPYALAAMKLAKKYPTVLTAHTLVDMDAKVRTNTVKSQIHDVIWSHYERKEIMKISNFIVVSKSLENEVKKRGGKNVYVIPNGISNKWFSLANKEVPGQILFVGRIIPIKNLEILIESISIIKNNIPEISLHIVGPVIDKVYYKKLGKLISKHNLVKNVIFTGAKHGDDLLDKYRKCSIFALSSESESYGIVVAEAMASGKPVVASNVGGIPEILTDGQEGFLVEYGNSELLADKLTTLLKDKDLREKMGQAGRERARTYDWETIAEQTVQVYKQVIKDFHGGTHT